MNEVIYGSLLCLCLRIIFDLLYCYNLSLDNFCECTFLIFFRGGGRGGDFDSDLAKACAERIKEQVQAKNRNKYKTRTDTRTTPHNQTRRQAGGFEVHAWSFLTVCEVENHHFQ